MMLYPGVLFDNVEVCAKKLRSLALAVRSQNRRDEEHRREVKRLEGLVDERLEEDQKLQAEIGLVREGISYL